MDQQATRPRAQRLEARRRPRRTQSASTKLDNVPAVDATRRRSGASGSWRQRAVRHAPWKERSTGGDTLATSPQQTDFCCRHRPDDCLFCHCLRPVLRLDCLCQKSFTWEKPSGGSRRVPAWVFACRGGRQRTGAVASGGATQAGHPESHRRRFRPRRANMENRRPMDPSREGPTAPRTRRPTHSGTPTGRPPPLRV